jgi:hypothetical protein
VRWLSVLVLALALVAVGCGGDDESSASADTTVEETTTTTDTTDETATDETTTDDGTGTDFDFADEDCQALLGAAAAFSQAFTGAGGDGGEAFAELQERVPDEIKADVQVLAEWYTEYASRLEDIGLEPGETPTAEQLQQLQQAIAGLDSAEVTEASQRLSTWAEQNCTG